LWGTLSDKHDSIVYYTYDWHHKIKVQVHCGFNIDDNYLVTVRELVTLYI